MRKSFVFLGVILIAGLAFLQYGRYAVSKIELDLERSVQTQLILKNLLDRTDTTLNVSVSGQHVTLYGTTKSAAVREEIAQVVSSTDGVTNVVNNISILPTSYPVKAIETPNAATTNSVLKKTIVIDRIVCAHDKCPSITTNNKSEDENLK